MNKKDNGVKIADYIEEVAKYVLDCREEDIGWEPKEWVANIVYSDRRFSKMSRGDLDETIEKIVNRVKQLGQETSKGEQDE